MSLPWIKLFARLPRHHKSDRLDGLLGRTRTWTHVVELWLWASEEAPDGDLSHFPARTIAKRSGWRGNAEKFVDALTDAGFVVDGRLNDWDEHQAAHVERAERVASPAESTDPADVVALRKAQRAARARDRRARGRDGEVTRNASRSQRDVTRNAEEATRNQSAGYANDPQGALTPVSARVHASESEREKEIERTPPNPLTGEGAVAPLLPGVPEAPLKPTRRSRPSKSTVVAPAGDVGIVWQAFLAVAPRSTISEDREKLIQKWLKPDGPFTAEQLVECIRGYGVSPHHNGENDTKTKYLGLGLMLRDVEKIEAGWGYLATHGSRPAERSGRQPDSTEVLKREPRPTPTPEEMQAAKEARDQLSRMVGGLIGSAKTMPHGEAQTPEAIRARRELLSRQAIEVQAMEARS